MFLGRELRIVEWFGCGYPPRRRFGKHIEHSFGKAHSLFHFTKTKHMLIHSECLIIKLLFFRLTVPLQKNPAKQEVHLTIGQLLKDMGYMSVIDLLCLCGSSRNSSPPHFELSAVSAHNVVRFSSKTQRRLPMCFVVAAQRVVRARISDPVGLAFHSHGNDVSK